MIIAIRNLFFLVICAHIINAHQDRRKPTERFVIQTSMDEPAVRFLAEQHQLSLVKRLMDNYFVMESRSGATALDNVLSELKRNEQVQWAIREEEKSFSKRGAPPSVPDYNDPLFPEQWYYQSEGQSDITKGSDHSIIDVWKMGYNGTGIKVVVIDDGFDHLHPDLEPNYNATLSLDLNEDDGDPYPRIPKDNPEYNSHGTKCGGQIAAVANNHICGVGIAHAAQIGGIKILDGSVTDSLEAKAFRHLCEEVDIYSMSWGPTDDGATFGGFMKLSYDAVDYCIKHGRRGLGSIYVWASGNGGSYGDCCSADSLVSSPYTVSIGALTHEGKPAYFQESCPSTLAAVYTGGVSRDTMEILLSGDKHEKSHPMVTTTIMFDSVNKESMDNCDEYFSGTSAAGPLGAGMIALLLQANSKLTWRDVQHIIVETCDQPDPNDADMTVEANKWRFNGDGRTVSHDFGFGVMNAAKMILAGETWINVPERHECDVATIQETYDIPRDGAEKELVLKFDASNCVDKVKFVEHVVAVMTYKADFRGSVQIELTSPTQYTSILMRARPKDNKTDELTKWPFTSFLHWGEKSTGIWTIKVFYNHSVVPPEQIDDFKAQLSFVQLVLYGTKKRHKNPSKSNPSLGDLGDEDLEEAAIEEQFKEDKKNNELIGEAIDGNVVKRVEERSSEASSAPLGDIDDFIDPYNGKHSANGYQPRINWKNQYMQKMKRRNYPTNLRNL